MKSAYLLFWFLLIATAPLLDSVHSQPVETASLEVGMYWKLNTIHVDEIHGERNYRGSFKETKEGVLRYQIEDVTGDEVRVSRIEAVSWVSEASGFFERLRRNIGESGSSSLRSEWVVDRSSTKILMAPASNESSVGKIFTELVNPDRVRLGDELPRGWVGLDGKYAETRFEVSETAVRIKGFDVRVWDIHYSGGTAGGWWAPFTIGRAGISPSSGKGEQRLYYDRTFGVLVGLELEEAYEYRKGQDYLEQKSRTTWTLIDSNMWHVNSFDADPRIGGLNIDSAEVAQEALPKAFLFSTGSIHKVIAPSEMVEGHIKYVFNTWSNGVNTNELSFASTRSEDFRAIYSLRYKLDVRSDHGSPSGEGWYDVGGTATFAVNPTVPVQGLLGYIGAKYVFERWSGDSNAFTPEATIVMDSAKTVEAIWRIDYTPVYIAVTIIFALLVIIVAVYRLKCRIDQVITRLQERYHIVVETMEPH